MRKHTINLLPDERKKIKIEILRVLFANKSALADAEFGSSFDGCDVIGEFILRITNTTSDTKKIYPDQGTIVIGTEQIELRDFLFDGRIASLDDVGGDILPGVIKIGGFYFGVKRSALEDITQVRFVFDGPNYKDPNFDFNIDVSGHEWEPIPDKWK